MIAPEKVTAKSVLTRLRAYDAPDTKDDPHVPMWLAEHEGRTWLVSGHFAFRPHPFAQLAFEQLWKECNLLIEPMRFVVGLAVTREAAREGTSPPSVEQLVPKGHGIGLDTQPLAASDLLLEDGDDRYIMWRRVDGSWSTFTAEYAALVLAAQTVAGGAERNAFLPATCWSRDGDLSAILMPVRIEHEGRLFRDPDLPPALFDVADLAPRDPGDFLRHGSGVYMGYYAGSGGGGGGGVVGGGGGGGYAGGGGTGVGATATTVWPGDDTDPLLETPHAPQEPEPMPDPLADVAETPHAPEEDYPAETGAENIIRAENFPGHPPCNSDDHDEQVAQYGNCAVCEVQAKLRPDIRPQPPEAGGAMETALAVSGTPDKPRTRRTRGKPTRTPEPEPDTSLDPAAEKAFAAIGKAVAAVESAVESAAAPVNPFDELDF